MTVYLLSKVFHIHIEQIELIFSENIFLIMPLFSPTTLVVHQLMEWFGSLWPFFGRENILHPFEGNLSENAVTFYINPSVMAFKHSSSNFKSQT